MCLFNVAPSQKRKKHYYVSIKKIDAQLTHLLESYYVWWGSAQSGSILNAKRKSHSKLLHFMRVNLKWDASMIRRNKAKPSLSLLWGHNEAKTSEKNEVRVGARRQLTNILLKGSLQFNPCIENIWQGRQGLKRCVYDFYKITISSSWPLQISSVCLLMIKIR